MYLYVYHADASITKPADRPAAQALVSLRRVRRERVIN